MGTLGFSPVNYNSLNYSQIEAQYPAIHGRDDIANAAEFELKAYYTFQIIFPAMRLDNDMMKENNIKLEFKANLTPLTAEGGIYTEITPLAFLFFRLGSKIGTGWDFPELNLNGLAINDPNFYFTPTRQRWDATSGAVSISEFQAVFQFDLAALIPGDWNHIVVVAAEKIEYWYFTGASNSQYWRWEHDEGENQNGFVWWQTFVVGYQMPKLPILEMIGFIVTTEQRITGKDKSPMASGGWGSDFTRVEFGPLINLEFNKHHSLTILAEFRTERQYTEASAGNRYFEYRHVNTDSPSYVQFYRIALSYSMKY
jgi:hypothetical protein